MADLNIYIQEKITLGGTDRGVYTTQSISNINYIDNRVMSLPSGSLTNIFKFDTTDGYGQFTTSSLKYARFTNKSSTDINLYVSSSQQNMVYRITAGNSFTISTTQFTGSFTQGLFTYNDYIQAVKAEPSSSAATIEYFIATT